MPVFSCCFLAFIPPIVVAAKSRTRQSATWAVGFTVAYAVGFALIGSQPEDTENLLTRLGAIIFIGAGLGAACYSVIAGRHLDWGRQAHPVPPSAPPPPPPPWNPNAGAVAGVMALRQKRAEARTLAQDDPQMARDLRIGRPDLPRHFDDGGLVDINGAPSATMTAYLGLSEVQAQRIVEVRQQLGKFEQADDLMNMAGLDLASYESVSDRIILL